MHTWAIIYEFKVPLNHKWYLLSIACKAGSWWVWYHDCPLSCSQLFPPVCFQTVAEGMSDLSILLRLLDVDVALCGGWPGIGEQATVLIPLSLSLWDQSATGLTVMEESLWLPQCLREKRKHRKYQTITTNCVKFQHQLCCVYIPPEMAGDGVWLEITSQAAVFVFLVDHGGSI